MLAVKQIEIAVQKERIADIQEGMAASSDALRREELERAHDSADRPP